MDFASRAWQPLVLIVLPFFFCIQSGAQPSTAASLKSIPPMFTHFNTLAIFAAILLPLMATGLDRQFENGKTTENLHADHQHDFDWEIGDWKVHLRRLQRPLTGSQSWVELNGTAHVRKVWNGGANLLELDLHGPAGDIEGVSLRLYDPKSKKWSVYYATRENGTLGTPMVGQFQNGRGDFFSRELFDGKMIDLHFVFFDVTDRSFRGEQSFSADGGKSWETNWIEDFTRAER